MFVKKDDRKLADILADESDAREELQLGRRQSEFPRGSLRSLCAEPNLPALSRVRKMSLYDNGLSSLGGIGLLGNGWAPLMELNLGKNCLSSLPEELGDVSTLERVWLDDNQLTSFPPCLGKLTRLRELRLSGNSIGEINPSSVAALHELRVLGLDGNRVTKLPAELFELPHLRSLQLRGNGLKELPPEIAGLAGSLEYLAVSTNNLTELPEEIGQLRELKELLANGNKIALLPGSLASLDKLEKVNLSNNCISVLPDVVERAWGQPVAATGRLDSQGVQVTILGNPLLNSLSLLADAQ
jgi:Leucine-rich repeat (LRR) protein